MHAAWSIRMLCLIPFTQSSKPNIYHCVLTFIFYNITAEYAPLLNTVQLYKTVSQSDSLQLK